MATEAQNLWVRERIKPDEWPIFIKLGYAAVNPDAINTAAAARIDANAAAGNTDLRESLADLLEIIDAQYTHESESNEGHAKSGPRYADRIRALRAATESTDGSSVGAFRQVPVTYAPVTTWDEYARELP
jgi:hypothetical protein